MRYLRLGSSGLEVSAVTIGCMSWGDPARGGHPWLMAQPAVTSPIVGVTKLEQLDDAIAAVDLELTDDQLAELSADYVPHAIAGHQ